MKIAIFKRQQISSGYDQYDCSYTIDMASAEYCLDVPQSEFEVLNRWIDKNQYILLVVVDKPSYLDLLKKCEEKQKAHDEQIAKNQKKYQADEKKRAAKQKERELKKAQKILEKYGANAPQKG